MGGLDRAMRWASGWHEGQTDKAGMAYIAHICHVVANVDGEDAKIVAALHDIVEDTTMTHEAIERAFGKTISDAVRAITKIKGEDYHDYLSRVARNPLARLVKVVDLRHNADLSRLKEPSNIDIARREKYLQAIRWLTDE